MNLPRDEQRIANFFCHFENGVLTMREVIDGMSKSVSSDNVGRLLSKIPGTSLSEMRACLDDYPRTDEEWAQWSKLLYWEPPDVECEQEPPTRAEKGKAYREGVDTLREYFAATHRARPTVTRRTPDAG